MQVIALLALAGAVAATPVAQAVTSAIAPAETDPAGCVSTYSGSFEISITNVSTTAKRSVQKRKDLTVTLSNGVLTDDEGRTGYIASNQQFQFDKPAQAGAIYTSGWSACTNGTLALGDSAVFYECLSGTFYNLYDASEGAQCSEVFINIISVSASATAKGAAASVSSDGQVTAASASAAVTQISDGQIQATTGVVVTQISDGQIQASTATPAAVVTQISDGQIQATTGTAAAVTQISDGQIQAAATTASTSAQATTAAVVTQISDGQIQAATSTAAVVSQISDGQIQAPTNGTSVTTASPSSSVEAYTGAASMPTARVQLFGLAAGVLALAAL